MKELKNKLQEVLSAIPNDKLLHFFYGSLISFPLVHWLEPLMVLGIVSGIAIFKEVLDGKYSVTDIAFTIAPAIMFIGATKI